MLFKNSKTIKNIFARECKIPEQRLSIIPIVSLASTYQSLGKVWILFE